MPLGKHLSFVPEAGLCYLDFHYLYSRVADPRNLYCDLDLFSMRLSPGLQLFPRSKLLIRLAPCIYLPALAFGASRVETFYSSLGYRPTIDMRGKFGSIHNPVDIGPEMSLGYRLLFWTSIRLTLRASAYLGTIPLIRANVSMPQLPLIGRASPEVVLHLGK